MIRPRLLFSYTIQITWSKVAGGVAPAAEPHGAVAADAGAAARAAPTSVVPVTTAVASRDSLDFMRIVPPPRAAPTPATDTPINPYARKPTLEPPHVRSMT